MGRDGRGWIGSIDQLPPEAAADVAWAMAQLNGTDLTQAQILEEFNTRLAELGLGPISKAAFNRRSMRVAAQRTRVDERNHLVASLAANITPELISNADIVIGELLKMLVSEKLDDPANTLTAKDAKELSEAYVKAIQGQTLSLETKRKQEEEFAKKTGEAIDKVAKVKGLTSDTVDAIKAQILGINRAAP